ncbi:glycosyl hydrolase family 25, putative [Babesia ovata]|uniref:Glycosyl hydrolase family 25, putative n=1 Tax=Babesia ovata TaxID=189622 RepID=A0A2H6KK97_9APIC|nr:glycosyl hydrolase family 25, putative [Babesia ovata]GBE63398.1 glycosyl hydrolase family 25, putative [Babesia ovata]
MLLPRNRLRPLIPIHVPPLQLLDEAHQGSGESVEHGYAGLAKFVEWSAWTDVLSSAEHSGDLSLEEAFEAGVQIVVDYRFHLGILVSTNDIKAVRWDLCPSAKASGLHQSLFEGVFGGFEKRFVELLYGELDILLP